MVKLTFTDLQNSIVREYGKKNSEYGHFLRSDSLLSKLPVKN